MTTSSNAPTFLPLPGEYIAVKMNPLAMVAPIADGNIAQALSRLRPLRKYCAVVYKYLEPISPSKPWHTCLLLLLAKNAKQSSTRNSQVDCSFEHSEFKIVPARLRTYSSPSSRIDLGRVSPEGLEGMFRRASGPKSKRTCILNKCGENKYYYTDERIPACAHGDLVSEVETIPTLRSDQSVEENRKINDNVAIYLLPHLDFDFNARQTVQSGTLWLDDHGYVLHNLFSVVPGIPERLQIDFTDLMGPADISAALYGEELYWRHYTSRASEISDRALVVLSPDTDPRLYVAHISFYCVSREAPSSRWLQRFASLFCLTSSRFADANDIAEKPVEEDLTAAEGSVTEIGTMTGEVQRADEPNIDVAMPATRGSWPQWLLPWAHLKRYFCSPSP